MWGIPVSIIQVADDDNIPMSLKIDICDNNKINIRN